MRILPDVPRAPDAGASPATARRVPSQRSFTAVLGEQPGARPNAPGAKQPHPNNPEPAAATSGASARAMLERVVSAENHLDTLLRAAARGKTFSPSELLALQAGVFRYAQTVEIASRVADRLVGAIKQTVGTNV
jgi:hypothetical protein